MGFNVGMFCSYFDWIFTQVGGTMVDDEVKICFLQALLEVSCMYAYFYSCLYIHGVHTIVKQLSHSNCKLNLI